MILRGGVRRQGCGRAAMEQKGRFSRWLCGFFVRHCAASPRARPNAKLPAAEWKARFVRWISCFLGADFAFR